jgi:hypothetical protein
MQKCRECDFPVVGVHICSMVQVFDHFRHIDYNRRQTNKIKKDT